jgi:hypothetical protein
MRLRTMAALGFATAAAGVAVAVGGAAYADNPAGTETTYQIVQDEQGAPARSAEDCPEKDGSGGSPAPGPTGEAEAGAGAEAPELT